MPQVGIYPSELDHSVFLRHDGTVPLTAAWPAVQRITSTSFRAGAIMIGEEANRLRLVQQADEIARILGVSNSEAELLQKNATMTDLAGVGVRAVVADVNGKLSAP